MLPPVDHYWPIIYTALTNCDESVNLTELKESLEAGTTVFWPITMNSVILTQISGRTLHFFVAAGIAHEVRSAVPAIEEYGRSMGCDTASLIGRKGWARSWLTGDEWEVAPLIVMKKSL